MNITPEQLKMLEDLKAIAKKEYNEAMERDLTLDQKDIPSTNGVLLNEILKFGGKEEILSVADKKPKKIGFFKKLMYVIGSR